MDCGKAFRACLDRRAFCFGEEIQEPLTRGRQRYTGKTCTGRLVSTCVREWAGVCCADELERAGADCGKSSSWEDGGGGAAGGGACGEILSELLGGIEGEPVQVELCGVRVLFELLGFLLKARIASTTGFPHRWTGGSVRIHRARSFRGTLCRP